MLPIKHPKIFSRSVQFSLSFRIKQVFSLSGKLTKLLNQIFRLKVGVTFEHVQGFMPGNRCHFQHTRQLQEIEVDITPKALSARVNRGTFSAVFLVQIFMALGADYIWIEQLKV